MNKQEKFLLTIIIMLNNAWHLESFTSIEKAILFVLILIFSTAFWAAGENKQNG